METESQKSIRLAKALDAAIQRRKGARSGEYNDVRCEVCGDRIGRYIGPRPGIICSNCIAETGEARCVRFKPLAITRGTMNE